MKEKIEALIIANEFLRDDLNECKKSATGKEVERWKKQIAELTEEKKALEEALEAQTATLEKRVAELEAANQPLKTQLEEAQKKLNQVRGQGTDL